MMAKGTPPPRCAGPSGEISPQLTALFTSAPIFASSAAVNSFSAKAVGHTGLASRFAASLKPNVAYLVLNFCALRKKQTTLPFLAYAGIPYQGLAERAGVLAWMRAWSRLAIARSGSGISAIFASTAVSPSALSARGPRRATAFSSWMRSFIAPRSSSVNPLDVLPIAVVLLADFCVPFFAGFLSAIVTDFSVVASVSWKVTYCSQSLPDDVRLRIQQGGFRALPSSGPTGPLFTHQANSSLTGMFGSGGAGVGSGT